LSDSATNLTNNLSDFRRWMILFTLVMLTFVEILDITIVAVSLLDIKGALGANPNQITWTMTSYTIAAAMVMPLAGYLSDKFGRKRLVILSACGFGFSSFLCGFAPNIAALVFFRGLQGLSGALLPVLAQSTLISIFPQEKRNKIMAIYGMGIMIAPIMGPVVGGLITDAFGWQWIFFVNVPVCIVMVFMAKMFLIETPLKERHADWLGMFFLVLAVCFMQFVLDKGNDDGWWDSKLILFCSIASAFFWIVFIVRGWGYSENIIKFQVFKNKNYTLACIAMAFCSAILYGSFTWVPLWLELVMGYSAKNTGLIMFPRGLAGMVTMMILPMVMKWIGVRASLGIFALVISGGLLFFSGFNASQSAETFFWPNLLMGFGAGFFFVPLASLAYGTLSPHLRDEASGLYNFSRSLGTSVGVAIFSAIMTQQSQGVWNNLTGFIQNNNPAFKEWLSAQNFSHGASYQVLAKTLYQQSMMQAFIDASYGFGIAVLFLIPFIFFFTDPHKK
jgi:MFS transporter, DHA2 family, multidrug resistance protein